MDLGCVDMRCIEKETHEISPPRGSSSSSSGSATATSKIGKNKGSKDSNGQSSWNAFGKCTSQIRKPSHRKTSPLNWFPRKKGDSYLQRKIQLLQQVDGMNSTLDETLGDSNPHYSRVLREKIAVKEAATKAMEARKAAMVEASWCRILKAACIECKDAEARLVEAEKVATEAFEAATAIGVTMYDMPSVPKRSCKIESSAASHAVSASFETAFEVDKQVAYAVKTALIKLASCSSIKKDEFKELLRRISQNPDSDEVAEEDVSGILSECDSDTVSECEGVSERFNMADLEEIMLGRLKVLHEDELASLATIVATCGLSAALAKEESVKKHDLGSRIPAPRRMSTFGAGPARNPGSELPSLDKFLVKKLSRLEREVLEAKNARNNEARGGYPPKQQIPVANPSVPGLGDVLVKHSSKLEKEIENARTNGQSSRTYNKKVQSVGDAAPLPSLDKFLVKHVSRLEREVQEAKRRRNVDNSLEKENINLNQKVDCCKEQKCDIHGIAGFGSLDDKKQDSLPFGSHCNMLNQQKGDIHGITGFQSLASHDGVQESLPFGSHCNMMNQRKGDIHGIAGFDGGQVSSPLKSHCKMQNWQKPDIHGIAGFGSLDGDSTDRMQDSSPFRSHCNALNHQQASSPFGTHCNMLNPQKGDIHGIAGFESSDSFNNDVVQEPSSSLRIRCNVVSQQKHEMSGIAAAGLESSDCQGDIHGIAGFESSDSFNNGGVQESASLRTRYNVLSHQQKHEMSGIAAGLESSDCNKNDRVQESTEFLSHCNNLNPQKGDIHGIAGFGSSNRSNNADGVQESASSMIHSSILSQQKRETHGTAGLESSDCNKNDRVHESTAFGSHCNSLNPQKGDIHGIAGFGSLGEILVKRVSRLEKEKMEFQAKNVSRGTKKESETIINKPCYEGGLNQVLVKHKSRLEMEKIAAASQPLAEEGQDAYHSVSRQAKRQKELQDVWGGSSLGSEVKHKSRIEREKMAAAAAAQTSEDDEAAVHSVSRRVAAKQKELQDAWGGMSLGNSMRPHLSRLQKEKAAWLQAEEEERKREVV